MVIFNDRPPDVFVYGDEQVTASLTIGIGYIDLILEFVQVGDKLRHRLVFSLPYRPDSEFQFPLPDVRRQLVLVQERLEVVVRKCSSRIFVDSLLLSLPFLQRDARETAGSVYALVIVVPVSQWFGLEDYGDLPEEDVESALTPT